MNLLLKVSRFFRDLQVNGIYIYIERERERERKREREIDR